MKIRLRRQKKVEKGPKELAKELVIKTLKEMADRTEYRESSSERVKIYEEIKSLAGTRLTPEEVAEVIKKAFSHEIFAFQRSLTVDLCGRAGVKFEAVEHSLDALKRIFPEASSICEEDYTSRILQVLKEETGVIGRLIEDYLFLKGKGYSQEIKPILESIIFYWLIGDEVSTVMWGVRTKPRESVPVILLLAKEASIETQHIIDQVKEAALKAKEVGLGWINLLYEKAGVLGGKVELPVPHIVGRLIESVKPYASRHGGDWSEELGIWQDLEEYLLANIGFLLTLTNEDKETFIKELASAINYSGIYKGLLAFLIKKLKVKREIIEELSLSQLDKEELAGDVGGPKSLLNSKLRRKEVEEELSEESRKRYAERDAAKKAEEERRFQEALKTLENPS